MRRAQCQGSLPGPFQPSPELDAEWMHLKPQLKPYYGYQPTEMASAHFRNLNTSHLAFVVTPTGCMPWIVKIFS